ADPEVLLAAWVLAEDDLLGVEARADPRGADLPRAARRDVDVEQRRRPGRGAARLGEERERDPRAERGRRGAIGGVVGGERERRQAAHGPLARSRDGARIEDVRAEVQAV